MQTYDLLMLLVLVATTMFGFWKGMAWQIASLASLVVSYIAALRFSAQLAPTFGEHAPWNRFVAMLVIYIVTSFVIWTLFRLVSGAIDKVRLESFDRQLGAMFGLAKGVLLCVAITFFAVTLLPPTQGEAIVASQSGRYIVALLDKSHTVFPPEVHQVVDPYINKIEERLNPGGFQPSGQDFQSAWPQNQASQPTPWPPQSWPQSQPLSQPLPQPTKSKEASSTPPTSNWPPAGQWPPLGGQPLINNPLGPVGQPSPPPQTQPVSTAQLGTQPLQNNSYNSSPPNQTANPFATPREAQLPDPYAVPHEPNPFPGPFSDE